MAARDTATAGISPIEIHEDVFAGSVSTEAA